MRKTRIAPIAYLAARQPHRHQLVLPYGHWVLRPLRCYRQLLRPFFRAAFG